MDIEQEAQRGQRAKQILDDPLIKEAFSFIESECVKQWQEAPARDTEGRERIWLMMKIAQKFKQQFESLVESGKLAQHEIAELEKQSRLKKIFG